MILFLHVIQGVNSVLAITTLSLSPDFTAASIIDSIIFGAAKNLVVPLRWPNQLFPNTESAPAVLLVAADSGNFLFH